MQNKSARINKEDVRMRTKLLTALFAGLTTWIVLSITHDNGYRQGTEDTIRNCPQIEGGQVKITVNDNGVQYCVFEGKNKKVKVTLR